MVPLVTRYFLSQGISRRSLRNFQPGLIRLAAELNHLDWGMRIRQHIRGQEVLDLGCGHTLYGVGFLVYGARSYLGIDPRLELDAPKLRRRGRFRSQLAGSPWTLRQVEAAMPEVRYEAQTVSELPAEARFDVVFMHNVTEHLIAIEAVFTELRQRLRPGGKVIFRHHNFAAWNGHHQTPRSIAEIDPASAAQKNVIDWAHLDDPPRAQAGFVPRLNRIRLHELRALTEKLFAIETWREVPSLPEQGAARLNDEILARHPGHSRKELLTQGVMCVAQVTGERPGTVP